MSEPGLTIAEHARRIVGGVVAAAVREANAEGIIVLEPGTPQGRLATAWLGGAIGADRVHGAPSGTDADGTIAAEEYERAAARISAREHDLLLAHPACKTVLLLSASVPPERLLPFGDVYATEIADWAGGLKLPADVSDLAERAGGIGALDAALRRWLEEHSALERALAPLPAQAGMAVADRLRRNRGLRRWPRCVPKLGTRTLWIDLIT